MNILIIPTIADITFVIVEQYESLVVEKPEGPGLTPVVLVNFRNALRKLEGGLKYAK